MMDDDDDAVVVYLISFPWREAAHVIANNVNEASHIAKEDPRALDYMRYYMSSKSGEEMHDEEIDRILHLQGWSSSPMGV